jgi:hypothetical protein
MARMEPAPLWPWFVVFALLVAGIAVLVGLLLNVHKMLARMTQIRRELEQAREAGANQHLVEAVAQLQSASVSLDRIAMRCDELDRKVSEIVQRGPGGGAPDDLGEAVRTLRDGLTGLQQPVAQIRDLLGRSESERLTDSVERTLYARGFDKVTILTDLTTAQKGGETRVLVEVAKDGVKSKGFVLLRDGLVVDTKISPTYEMFP